MKRFAKFKIQLLALILLITSFFACQNIKKADLLIHNAKIYTVDSVFTIAEAMAIKDGVILEIGPNNQLKNKYQANREIDARLQFIYPGFIDAHCHFLGYGRSFYKVDLVGSGSWDEVVQKTLEFAQGEKKGWIFGRGWDQNDWKKKDFPTKRKLDSLFPDRAVVLQRIDGHAAIANQKALDLARIDKNTEIEGGVFVKADGKLSGLLIDAAVSKVMNAAPALSEKQIEDALTKAEKECFSVGLTTLDDAGTDFQTLEVIKKMYDHGSLKIRLYVMLTPSQKNRESYLSSGPFFTDRLSVRAFKYYADGALGSRGAYLKNPYKDEAGNRGLLLEDSTFLAQEAKQLYENGFQMNTHCIGDAANRLMLEIYGQTLNGSNDKRWRIEHAQIVDGEDQKRFGEYNIIPSVQPTHATSDMYWLESRLGNERMKYAYAYRDLMEENGLIALGTDFPVEDINPLNTFYAAVFRKDHKGYPQEGFQMENALSRKAALKGMTIWNAIANFEEMNKGSLEKGKWADFVILDQDLMNADANDILDAKVISTYVNGEKVYGGID